MPCLQRAALQLARSAATLVFAACGQAAVTTPPSRASQSASSVAAPARTSFVSPYSYEWFARAELLEARGEHAAAADAYRMALSSADDDSFLLARLAEALDQAGDRAGAERELKTGLELDPHSEAVWLELGRIARRHGAIAQALAAFERAETAAPSSPEAPLALSELLHEQGHTERALAVLERFAARSEQGSLPWLRARLELARVRNDGAALAAAAGAWLEHAGGHAELLRKLAAELLAAGRSALASRVLAAIPPDGQDARLRLQVGLALMQRSEVELLLRTTPPETLGGPLEIAAAYLRIGLPQRALEALDEQTAAVESDPHRRALLQGLALLDSGQPARAAILLARVPADSAYHARAARGLSEALEAAGLAALAREVKAQSR